MNGLVENMSLQTPIRTKHRRIIGIMAISLSVLLYGINVCYAKLSQLVDIAAGNGYMERLIYYYEPVLSGVGFLTFLFGGILIVRSITENGDN